MQLILLFFLSSCNTLSIRATPSFCNKINLRVYASVNKRCDCGKQLKAMSYSYFSSFIADSFAMSKHLSSVYRIFALKRHFLSQYLADLAEIFGIDYF